jgi:hypothetical protein
MHKTLKKRSHAKARAGTAKARNARAGKIFMRSFVKKTNKLKTCLDAACKPLTPEDMLKIKVMSLKMKPIIDKQCGQPNLKTKIKATFKKCAKDIVQQSEFAHEALRLKKLLKCQHKALHGSCKKYQEDLYGTF